MKESSTGPEKLNYKNMLSGERKRQLKSFPVPSDFFRMWKPSNLAELHLKTMVIITQILLANTMGLLTHNPSSSQTWRWKEGFSALALQMSEVGQYLVVGPVHCRMVSGILSLSPLDAVASHCPPRPRFQPPKYFQTFPSAPCGQNHQQCSRTTALEEHQESPVFFREVKKNGQLSICSWLQCFFLLNNAAP